MKRARIKKLEESLDSGAITKEEFEAKKKETEAMPEDEKKESPVEDAPESSLKSDRMIFIIIGVIIIAIAAVFGISYFNKETPTTIDELHELNIRGKLDPEQGYMHNNAYSFVKYDSLWYTQFTSQKGSKLYNVQFRYSPRELEDIPIEGSLDMDKFNNATRYYVTFNPVGGNFSAMALAVGDFNEHLTKIFFKEPIAACDRNETTVCTNRPIITCDNTEEIVLYVMESETDRVVYQDNCIIAEGSGFGIVKAVDKALLNFYGFIEN